MGSSTRADNEGLAEAQGLLTEPPWCLMVVKLWEHVPREQILRTLRECAATTACANALIIEAGPTEWWVLTTERLDAGPIAAALPGLAVDMSSAFVRVPLPGSHASRVLARLCALPYASDALKVGAGRRARLADCTGLIVRDQEGVLGLIVRRSEAAHIRRALAEASRE
jgi:heterotetrameric sarcosine oxidase gamma subunit